MEFVNSMRKKGQLIMGIGHRVKSVSNQSFFMFIDKLSCLQVYVKILGVGIASENRIVIYCDFWVCIEIRITIYRKPK